jgi:hypothetical protein
MEAKNHESADAGDRSGHPAPAETRAADHDNAPNGSGKPALPLEIGGRAGPDPTRFGDWEKNGRCIDF